MPFSVIILCCYCVVRGGQQAAMANGIIPSASGRLARLSRGVGISSTGLILAAASSDSDDEIENGRERFGFDRLRSVCIVQPMKYL